MQRCGFTLRRCAWPRRHLRGKGQGCNFDGGKNLGLWYCATLMDLTTTMRVLEWAILEVAKAEYTRLSAGLAPHEVAGRVERALKSLGGLRKGVAPAYNEWDALFYLTWYQPRHVSLNYLVASHLFSDGPQPVHVIDFGCGALASRFAFAVSAAMLDVPPSELHVDLHGIDNSEHMVRIGEATWSKFISSVSDTDLAAVCTAMDYSTYASYEDYRRSPAAHASGVYPSPNCYLLGVHTTYESNKVELRETFSQIRAERDPAATILVCQASKEHVALQVVGRGFRQLRVVLERSWYGQLQSVTQWRRSLVGQLPTADPILRSFLQRPVQWRPPPREIRVLISP